MAGSGTRRSQFMDKFGEQDWNAVEVARWIREEATDWQRTKPGKPIPLKRKMRRMLGDGDMAKGPHDETMSRALNMLLVEGFLVYRSGRGLLLAGEGGFAESELAATLEFRLQIEPGAAALAARDWLGPVTPAKEAFRKAYRALQGARYDKLAEAKADRAFHEAIRGLVRNPLLRRALAQSEELILANVIDVVTRLYGDTEYLRKTREQHDSIHDAIKLGDEKEARKAMFDHLEYAHGQIANWLRAQESAL